MAEMDIAEVIKAKVGKLGNCSEEQKQKLMNALSEVLINGKTLMEGLGISAKELEFIYDYAYNLYKNSKFEESNNAFQMLSMMNPNDFRFLFGCAASFQKLNKWDKAIGYYWQAIRADPANPTSWFHMSDCYLKKNDNLMAMLMLKKSILTAGDNPHYAQLKHQASVLYEVIQKTTNGEPITELEALKGPPDEEEINNNEPPAGST